MKIAKLGAFGSSLAISLWGGMFVFTITLGSRRSSG